ncbi:MAG: gliding motility-associated C-terminal domain-containing protein, partial [Ekhidna sp.]|uniref:gliding motility-associated C-terminal domain-containing protein n=1 Tax=Ekhidna sp. TaxID=2608089 RepID=UPI0032EB5F94
NTVCDETLAIGTYNGQITVNSVPPGTEGDYTYAWFDGAGTSTPTAFTETNNVLSDAPGGTYTVRITSLANACDTTIQVIIQNDLSDIPIIEANGLGSTVFDIDVCQGHPDYPSGGIDANVTGGSSNFTYEWYYGTGTNPTRLLDNADDIFTQKGIAGTASVDVTGADTEFISGLNPGNYTLRVLDNETGCYGATRTFVVEEDLPALALDPFTNISDNFSCSAVNGTATANGTGATGVETYEWYTGSSATGTPFLTAQTATGLDGGIYTVKYIDGATNCFATAQITIVDYDQTVTATAVVDQDQTNCDPNGTVRVNSNTVSWSPLGPPRGYAGPVFSYQWYFGPGTGTPITDGDDLGNGSDPLGSTTNTMSGLAAGVYTVVVTDTETGCVSTTETVTVDDLISANAPDLEFEATFIPSSCDGVGDFRVRLATNPTGNTFSFEFYEGAQDYANTVVATPLASGDQLVSNPGPTITVNVADEDTPLDPYVNDIAGVVSGIYTIVVEDQTTGCRYQEFYELPFIGQQTTTTITVENVDECPDNGVARVGLADNIVLDISAKSGPFQEFETYTTSGGATGTISVDGAAQLQVTLISGTLNPGDIITGDASLETATIDAVTAGYFENEVDDISEYILFLYAGTGIPADREAPYTFEGIVFPLKYNGETGGILDGNDDPYLNFGELTPALNLDDEAEFFGLPAGPYIAVAREKLNPAFNITSTNQCWSQASFDREIIDLAYEALIDDVDITSNSTCDFATFGGNGEISVTVVEDPTENLNDPEFQQPAGYSYSLRSSSNALIDTLALVGNETETFTTGGLGPDDYTVRIWRAFETHDISFTPGVGTFEDGEVVEFTPSGAVGIITTGGVGADLNIYVTTGTPVNGDAVLGTGSEATGTVTNVALGDIYSNGCFVSTIITIDDDPEEHEIVNATVIDYNNCDGLPASEITIEDNFIEIAGAGQLAADYTYQWFKGATFATATDITGTVGDTENIDISGLTPVADTYYVIATRDANGCVTPPFEVVVNDNTEDPSIVIVNTTPDTSCDADANEGNGSITFRIDNPELNTGYTYQWYAGPTTGSPALVDNGVISGASGPLNGPAPANYEVTLSGIDGGTYTLEIIDNEDNSHFCSDITTVTVNEESVDPTLILADNVSLQDNQNCTDPNGFIQINSVKENGIDIPVNAVNYSFAWFKDGVAFNDPADGSIVSAGGTNNRIEDIEGGLYSVEITNTATECTSTANIDIDIDDIQIDPVIQLVSRTADTYCVNTDNVGDGTIVIDVFHPAQIDVPLNAAEYTIEWYRGTTVQTPAHADFLFDNQGNSNAAPTVIGDATPNGDFTEITGMSDGQYTVFVSKNIGAVNPPNFGCDVSATFTINNDEPVLTIPNVAANIDFQDNENCTDPNGFIEILNVLEDGNPIAVSAGNYSFQWFFDPTGANTNITGTAVVGLTEAGANNDNRIEDLTGGTYRVIVTNETTGCTNTAQIDIDIDDIQIDPVITLNAMTEDTFCDNLLFEGDGALTVNLSENGAPATLADYSVEWYRGTYTMASYPGTGSNDFIADETNGTGTNSAQPNAGDAVVGVNILSLTGLTDGTYTVYVSKDEGPLSPNFGCTDIATFTIGNNEDVPTLDVAAIQARALPDTVCGGFSGVLTLDDLDIDGDLSDYTIQITQGNGGPDVFNATGISPQTELTGLEPADYYIYAQNATTSCFAAVGVVNVKDSVRNPLVTLETATPDENCGGTVNVGGLEVLVNGVYDHTNQGFLTFLWEIAGGGALPVPVTDNEAILSGVPAGNYQVTVTNTNTTCQTVRTFNVPNVPVFPSIINYEVNNKTYCFDNGSFVLLEIIQDGVTYDEVAMDAEDFTLEVFRDSDDASQGTVSTSPYEIAGLAADDYYAVVTNNDTGCPSGELDFTIVDNPFFPEIIIAIDAADSTCAPGATHDGTLTALADGEDHTNVDYTFQWYFGAAADIGGSAVLLDGSPLANGSVPIGFDESTISGLAAGLYSVEVFQVSSGCTSTAQITVPNVPVEVEIISVVTRNSTACSPSNGEIEVTAVERNDQADVLGNYTFDYYDENPNNVGATPVFSGGALFNQASAGTYFIIGTNTVVNCTTPIFQVVVGEDITLPEVTNIITIAQDNCDPTNPNGAMSIFIDDPLTPGLDEITPALPDYTVEWYFGSGTGTPLTDALIGGNGTLTGETTANVSGLPGDQEYTFRIIDNSTGCSITETEFLPSNERSGFDIGIDVVHNKLCTVVKNGRLTARVKGETSQAPYDFYWFNGFVSSPYDSSLAIGTVQFENNDVLNVEAGDYTVLVVEKGDRYCTSVEFATVNDNIKQTPFTLETRPVTVCFATKDGFAKVTIPDDEGAVSPQWFDDGGNLISTSNAVNNLDAGTYRLVLTDEGTGCTTTEVFDILDESELPSAPSVIVLNARTNCTIANGQAKAEVDGITDNFLFEWFDPNNMSSPYATGALVTNLDTVTYLVQATNLATGCESPLTPVEINYEVEDPEFEINVENSICLRTEDGATNQFTGRATVSFSEFQDPSLVSYEWIYLETGEVVSEDDGLADAFPGEYAVRFNAANGCDYYAEFTLETALNIYNGVSANGDGKNDFFLIDCIDFYPGNNVKIFNRAGQRVFDMDGYNNTSERFEGFSNVGGGGLKLPPGTYFYVVDLGTGEDPIQGYLELVR